MKGNSGSAGGLRAVFICQTVDRDDPVSPGTIRWIEALARKKSVDQVIVLALRTGRYDLPAGVAVHRFGRSSKLATVVAFYRAVARSLRPRPNFFFVYQGGPYPLLLFPFKLFMGILIVQWKAHPVITRAMALYARWCDDLILTSAPTAFPMDLDKVRVVGQGIDTDHVRADARQPVGDLIAACRIAPVKRIDGMIKAVVQANRSYGTGYRFNVYGPTLPGDETHAAELEGLIDRLEARDWVALHGPVSQEHLPELLNAHRAYLNFSATAIDRSVMEAMACELPVVSTNDSISEIMPEDLRSTLITDKERTEIQARAIHDLLEKPEAELARLRQRMRALMVNKHSVDLLFDRILEEVRELLCDRA
jgi:glycosyltransferase involved in cell wall biosynthesis